MQSWCNFLPLFTTGITKSLSSASKIQSLGCEIELKPTHSALHRTNGDNVLLRSSGHRDVLVLRVAKKQVK